jgi:hypothetical protein
MRALLPVTILALAMAGCTTDDTDDGTPNISAVTVTDAPTSGAPGATVEVCWHVEGSGDIPHTALHFDNETHGTSGTFSDYGMAAAPPSDASAPFSLPGDFCADVTLPQTGPYYFVAHAMVSPPGVVSDPQQITIA